jgi:hypothetical protein
MKKLWVILFLVVAATVASAAGRSDKSGADSTGITVKAFFPVVAKDQTRPLRITSRVPGPVTNFEQDFDYGKCNCKRKCEPALDQFHCSLSLLTEHRCKVNPDLGGHCETCAVGDCGG